MRSNLLLSQPSEKCKKICVSVLYPAKKDYLCPINHGEDGKARSPLKNAAIKRLKKFNKIRLHHEGQHTLLISGLVLLLLVLGAYLLFDCKMIFYIILMFALGFYAIMVNFFRCPIRYFDGDTEGVVVAPADGKVVVVEEVDENEYFHERRIMVSIFMSVLNVHANWFPTDGYVKTVVHQNGNYHRAFLPKASLENERSTIIIETPHNGEVMVRQIAGAVARRIVTYARENEDCYIDEHLGFIKFGSRVDVYLPLDAEVCVTLGQKTVGDNTVIARLPQSQKNLE